MMAIAVLLLGLLPPSRLKNRALGLVRPRWSIDGTARIHSVVLWRVERLRLGRQALVGPGNVFRSMALVQLAEGAQIGQFNWFSAAAEGVSAADESLRASLVMAEHSGITSRHYVDCSGGLVLEQAVLMAGVRSTVLTHSINAHTWCQEARPVRIGRSCVLFSHVLVTAGATLAPNCLVAGGAVVTGDLAVPGRLYGGVPAKEIADVSSSAYADRVDCWHLSPAAPATV